MCYAPRNYSAQGQAKEEFQDDLYAYDPAGNLLSDQDKTGGQWQCYGYDHFPRLAQAWTTTGSDGCAGGVRGYTPAATGAYQQSYSYDIAGNTTAVTTGLTTPAKTITRYTYPEPVQAHPHAPVTVGATSFAYDSDGNLTRQVTGQARQLYDWDSQGQLTTVTAWQPGHKGAQVASFAYGSDGNRIIRRDPGGATTLYLPGTELASDGTTLTATRYYSVGGTTIGTRTTSPGVTGGVVTWLTGNPQGSPQYAITATTGKPFGRQRYLPYGGLNGGRTISVTSRAFLGQPLDDSTGLIADGARYYNPATGQFISPDPVINPADPDTLNAYAYASSNPATWTDPTGLITGGITAPGGQICTPEVLAAGDCGHTSGGGGSSSSSSSSATTSPFTGSGCNAYVENCDGDASSSTTGSSGGGCPWYGCLASDVAHRVADVVGGAVNGITDLARPIGTALYDMVPCYVNAGGIGYCQRVPSGQLIPLGDPSSFFYKAGYYGAPFLAAGPAAGEELGSLSIEGEVFSVSEKAVAQSLADQGNRVVLREATGIGRTSDLLVNGTPYDVYTPEAGTTVRNILSSVASKWTQVNGGGVVVDLGNTELGAADFGDNALARVNGFVNSWGGMPISDVIFCRGG